MFEESLSPLWVEKYRPKAVEEYIFKNQNLQMVIKEWIKKQELPSLLLHGPAGTGKCLCANEILEFKFSDTSETHLFSIKEIFEQFNAENIEYEKFFTLENDSLFVNSPSGFVPVRHLVRKHYDACKYYFDNGTTLECSTQHIVFTNGEPVLIENASVIDTIDGKTVITHKEYMGMVELYDISVDFPHQYITPNGVIHHNTSLIKVMLNEIESIDPSDVLELNMSDEGIEAIREKVLPFVQTIPFGKFKIVILEEFEQCSQKGQGSLKRIMEEYSSTARFLVTSNAPNKILPPIRSRLQEIQIETHDYNQFVSHIIEILQKENVQILSADDVTRIEKYIKATYPDFRKCINTLQQNCIDNKIIELNDSTGSTNSFELVLSDAITSKNLDALRESIISNISEDSISSFFTFLYKNVDLWEALNTNQDSSILKMMLIIKIRDGMVKDTLCEDRYMNMAATLCELQLTASGN